jgi:hypothetical protein
VFFACVERALLPAAFDFDSALVVDVVFDSALDFVFAVGWRSGSLLR